jgi:ATP-dependent Clp protease adaptor protein ClpS
MSDIAVKTREVVSTNIKTPSRYKVIVLNDDYTPMEFVIIMLMAIFKHGQDDAVALTMKIHNEGSAVAGIYNYEIAEQRAIDATQLAREHGHPLVVRVEEE